MSIYCQVDLVNKLQYTYQGKSGSVIHKSLKLNIYICTYMHVGIEQHVRSCLLLYVNYILQYVNGNAGNPLHGRWCTNDINDIDDAVNEEG